MSTVDLALLRECPGKRTAVEEVVKNRFADFGMPISQGEISDIAALL